MSTSAIPSTARPSGLVRTVLGDISPRDLGLTLVHEHLICDLTTYWRPDDDPTIAPLPVTIETLHTVRLSPLVVRENHLLQRVDVAIAEVAAFRRLGGASIVEASSNGLGRDVRALALIAKATGVNVIAGCGYYIAASRPAGFAERDETSLADELVLELTVGVGDTGIRAGVIGEIGIGQYPMVAQDRAVLRAAARAQAKTGAGMIVHPAPGIDSAFEIADVLTAAGAVMRKVMVAHIDTRFRNDLELFRRIAAYGVLFGFDTFGREDYHKARKQQHPSDSERIDTLVSLWEAGLGNRVALAQDICHQHELAAFGGPGYTYVIEAILPRMRMRGITDGEISQMFENVPVALLTLSAAAGGSP